MPFLLENLPRIVRITTRKSWKHLASFTRFNYAARLLCTKASNLKVKDCYLLLGVDWSASVVDVREAYLKLAKLYHPDCGRSTADAAKFAQIQQAYRVVMDHLTTAAQTDPEVTDEDFDKEIAIDIHHTAPQHRWVSKKFIFLFFPVMGYAALLLP